MLEVRDPEIVTVYINETFRNSWKDANVFEQVRQIEGEVYRQVASRRTLKFSHLGANYFLKAHYGVGWAEVLKNFLFLRMPILGARNEWFAIKHLQALDIDTMTVAVFGEQGFNPARRESFIVTEALEDTLSLEDYCAEWPIDKPDYALKKALIEKVASISRRLHHGGVTHRDYYICHFHLDLASIKIDPRCPKLHVIDLHRAQIRDQVPRRWILKDIAGLLYSALGIGLTKRDLAMFIQGYSGISPRQALESDRHFWDQVIKKAVKMYRADGRAVPDELATWLR